jgi:hypothetical protein
MALLNPFYLNNVLVTPDVIKNILSVHQFPTDNRCSMEFDPFDLSMKDLTTKNVTTRCNTSGPLYTIRLPTTRASQASTYYALTTATTPPLGPDALLKLSTTSVIICNKP